MTDFGSGPREWSPRWKKGSIEDAAREILRWLKQKDLAYGVTLYSQEDWRKREEKYGNEALLTLTAEGNFNHIMNYPESKAAFRLIDEWNAFLDKLGLWAEQGYSWTWHLYPKEGGSSMGDSEEKKPLLTVLGTVADTRPGAVFKQADRYFCLRDLVDQVRREIKRSGGAKEALEAAVYSAELDGNDDFIIYREEDGQKKVTFVEARSKVKTDPWG